MGLDGEARHALGWGPGLVGRCRGGHGCVLCGVAEREIGDEGGVVEGE